MKPRRTFQSVVTELIEGLKSGEIVLDKDADKLHPPTVFISHQTDDFKTVGFDAFTAHDRPNWVEFEVRVLESILSSLRDVKKREVAKTDLEKNVARAKDRIWLLVSDWTDYAVTRDILTDFFIAKVPHHAGAIISPAQHEIRILLAEMKHWEEWRTLFTNQGLTGNVRVANAELHGWWLAFADSNLFVDVRRMDAMKNVYGFDPGMFVVEERSDPTDFHHLEKLFDELWKNSASDTGIVDAPR